MIGENAYARACDPDRWHNRRVNFASAEIIWA
jgi:hypothetical protein